MVNRRTQVLCGNRHDVNHRIWDGEEECKLRQWLGQVEGANAVEDGRVGLAFPADKEFRAKRCRVRKSVSKCPRDLTQPGL